MKKDAILPDQILGFRTLEFDLPTALLAQVIAMFEKMNAAPLSPNDTTLVPNAKGVYQLFHRGKLVYVGKVDGKTGLRQRLSRHAWNIQSRSNLDVCDLSFKAIQVLVFSAMDLEKSLIAHYKKQKHPPVWNGSGFGNNDPGRRRDTTVLKSDGFDALHPINIDLEILASWNPNATALEALSVVGGSVPYKIRHSKSKEGLKDLGSSFPKPVSQPTTARQAIARICSALPEGWQATRLSGRVILYKENKDDYPRGEVIASS